MKLPALASVSPMKALIAVGVVTSAVINYNEFYGDSAPATPTADEAVAAPPSISESPPVARSPIDRLKDSAEAGNVNHQLTLAAKYSTADGVVRDQAEASRWYLMAAQGGDVPAMYEVNMRYRHGHGLVKNIAEADVWRQRAAIGGHAEAALSMAHAYGVVTVQGAVISKDRNADIGESSKQLVTWLSRAAESGSAAAKHELALVRLFGISRGNTTKTSYLVPLASATYTAVQLLRENADSGYWASQKALAELYQTGYADIKPDPIESNKWWQRLNEQTDASVQASIGAHYLASDTNRYLAGEKNKWQGKSLSYDDTNQVAFEWFARAGAQANKDALWQLAMMEYSGTGTSKNPAIAMQLHQKAAELGQLDAMYYLGIAYTTGNAVARDYANALHWLVRSASYEDAYGSNNLRALAQNALGTLYESGSGISVDLVLAYAWYQLASAGGLESASESSIRLRQLLNSEQVLEAEDLAGKWKPGNQPAAALVRKRP